MTLWSFCISVILCQLSLFDSSGFTACIVRSSGVTLLDSSWVIRSVSRAQSYGTGSEAFQSHTERLPSSSQETMDNISVACACYLTCALSKPTAYSCPWKTLVELWQENRRIPNFLSLRGFCLCVNLRRGAAEKSVETPLAIFFPPSLPLFFLFIQSVKRSPLCFEFTFKL